MEMIIVKNWKTLTFALCVTAMWLQISAPPGLSQVLDAALKRPTQLSLRDATAEKGLLEIARSSNWNFLIDSTNIPADSARISRVYNDKFLTVVIGFAQEQKLSALRFGQNTFLFWSEPDSLETARLIAGGQGLHLGGEPPSAAQLTQMLAQWLEHDPTHRKFSSHFKIADLPQEMQAPMASAVLFSLMNDWPRRHVAAWFSDQVWDSARASLVPLEHPDIEEFILVKSTLDSLPGVELQTQWPFTELFTKANLEKSAATKAQPNNNEADELLVRPASSSELTSDTGPRDEVTFSVARRPLSEILLEVRKQSGVRLSSDDDPAISRLLLSAHMEKIPLFQLMNALSRLYGFQWKRSGDRAWNMEAFRPDDLRTKLLQFGDLYYYRIRLKVNSWRSETQALQELTEEMLENVDATALKSPQGLAFRQLPSQIQNSIRERIQGEIAMVLIGQQIALGRASGQELTLRVAGPRNLQVLRNGQVRSTIQLAAPLFPDLPRGHSMPREHPLP